MRWPRVFVASGVLPACSRSPHCRGPLDHHDLPDPQLDAPLSIDRSAAAGESRWMLH
jgi:hypothetical protein